MMNFYSITFIQKMRGFEIQSPYEVNASRIIFVYNYPVTKPGICDTWYG